MKSALKPTLICWHPPLPSLSPQQLAQSLTQRPMKGMLTGPITVLNWSFPRKDISRRAQAMQLAAALRQEVAALEAAGCRVVQVSGVQGDAGEWSAGWCR